jgi:hypothetical protein
MSRRDRVWIFALGGVLAGLAVTAFILIGRPGADQRMTPPRNVRDQPDAIYEATCVDLPQLDLADKVVIVECKESGDGRTVTLVEPRELIELRRCLVPKRVPASGGVNAAILSFYRGGALVRKVWVFAGGEWGFERPGISHTTGWNPNLWKVINKHFMKDASSVQALSDSAVSSSQ